MLCITQRNKNPPFSGPQSQELVEGGPGLDAGIIIIVVHLVVYAAAVLDIEYLVESFPKKTIFILVMKVLLPTHSHRSTRL